MLSSFAFLWGLFAAQAGGMDMAAAQKWGAAKAVRYHAVGVHDARTSVVFGDYEGKADVLDRVTLDFTLDVRKMNVTGAIGVTDGKSELRNIRSDGTNCGPPQLKGDYEHFQSASTAPGANNVQIDGTRTYPPAMVSNYPGSCSMRAIPGRKEPVHLWMPLVAPAALAMPATPGGPMTIAPDRKSFSVKAAEGWTWTFTPTLVN